MKLRFSPQATQDLIEIADYIRLENPPAAERVRGAILESLQNLVVFPRIGRRQSVEGVRKLVTRRFGYLVYYSIDEPAAEIVILAIRHPARARLIADE
jgi:plasmid stabilization system protein ParE